MSRLFPWLALSLGVVALYVGIDHRGYRRAEATYKAKIVTIQADYATASAKAAAKQIEYNKQKEAEYAEKSQKADEDYVKLATEYDANLLRYAQHQVRAGAGVSRPKDTATGGDNGPGTSPGIPPTIVISYKDALICAENTGRLKEVQLWGLSINPITRLNYSKLLTTIPRSSVE